jgi:NAD(P)-dependent dehydrogenase (short-subunit alcohol dehydrogenase family)
MQHILITGANRGLGLEFSRQYLQRGAHVFAGCRQPEAAQELRALEGAHSQRLSIISLDVADADSIQSAYASVRAQTDKLDVLINSAGIFSTQGSAEPSERPGNLTFQDALSVLRVNAVAPLIIVQQFLDLIRAGHHAKIIAISSEYGSVSANMGSFPYYYSASKAALNMFMRSWAGDVKRWGISTVLLDPGWVSTDMGGSQAPTTPEQSVRGMLRMIDSLTPQHNGRFFTWEGEEQAW